MGGRQVTTTTNGAEKKTKKKRGRGELYAQSGARRQNSIPIGEIGLVAENNSADRGLARPACIVECLCRERGENGMKCTGAKAQEAKGNTARYPDYLQSGDPFAQRLQRGRIRDIVHKDNKIGALTLRENRQGGWGVE